MATTALTNTPGSSHGNVTAGHTGSQSAPVAPAAQHRIQQANTSPSTTSTLLSTPSPASRPASPSSSPSTSNLVQSSAVPPPQTTRGKFRRCWNKVSTIAAWVAIVFTIASFVRDYLDITKDSPLSPQESWELQNDFRLSCEYDRRAELQSDACDLALSKPASPPPGISKRALYEPSVKRESCNTLCPRIRTGNVVIFSLNRGRSTPQAAALVDCFFEWTNVLLLLGVAIMSTRFHKLPRRRREQARNICSGAPSAPSRKEQDTVPSGPSEQPHENENGIGPMLWSEVVATSVAFVVLLLQVTWIYSLPSYKRLIFGAYEGELEFAIATLFESSVCLLTLLSGYTNVKLQEILLRLLCTFQTPCLLLGSSRGKICMQRWLMRR